MDRREFFDHLCRGAVTGAAVGSRAVVSGTRPLRVIDPTHVGIRTWEWQDGEAVWFSFDHLIHRDIHRDRLNVGERIRMDARHFKGPVFEGVVTAVDDQVVGARVMSQRIVGVRT